jgi:hypothetical protein
VNKQVVEKLSKGWTEGGKEEIYKLKRVNDGKSQSFLSEERLNSQDILLSMEVSARLPEDKSEISGIVAKRLSCLE